MTEGILSGEETATGEVGTAIGEVGTATGVVV